MTDETSPPPPPPDGGSYPPPPPSSGGFAPPPPAPALPTESYTPWATRALAFIIDNIPVAIVVGIGYVIQMVTMQETCVAGGPYGGQYCVNQPSGIGNIVYYLTLLAAFAFAIWNNGYKQGITGQSIGKSMTKFKVVSEKTGQPIGFGMSVARMFAHIVDAIPCYIGYLFPLWDAKRQTLADKIMTTVCLPADGG
jgi:uncharacterized RDD family membrane protein YckC